MTKTEQLERRVDHLERENEHLKRDVATIAHLVRPHVHPKDGLLEIIERHNPGGQETRPYHAEEQRAKVA